MLHKINGKDNSLLVEFEFVVDLDLAMYRYVKHHIMDFDGWKVDTSLLNTGNMNFVIDKLLNRKHINPLELIFPENDVTDLYYELMGEKYNELIKYATIYDTFGLMVTFLQQASSVNIDILCKNELEKAYIQAHNSNLNCMIADRSQVNLNNYSGIYTKYLYYIVLYKGVDKKHIYIPMARYNLDPELNCPNIDLTKKYGFNNEIHMIDMYRFVKFDHKMSQEEMQNLVKELARQKQEEDKER